MAANQTDEIVVIEPSGRVIAKLGDFNGLDSNGAPNGLLFPASLVRSGEFIYVTNLALVPSGTPGSATGRSPRRRARCPLCAAAARPAAGRRSGRCRTAPGDIIYSGTPENVGPVVRGDVIECHIDGLPNLSVKIV